MSKVSLCVLALSAASARAFTRPATSLVSGRRIHSTPALRMNIINQLLGKGYDAPCVMGDESIMDQKAHGTSNTPVQENLRWSCDRETAGEWCA